MLGPGLCLRDSRVRVAHNFTVGVSLLDLYCHVWIQYCFYCFVNSQFNLKVPNERSASARLNTAMSTTILSNLYDFKMTNPVPIVSYSSARRAIRTLGT